jgi:hypothetical protein
MLRRLIVDKGSWFVFLMPITAFLAGCSDTSSVMAPSPDLGSSTAPMSVAAPVSVKGNMAQTGAVTANGWYEEEEIYYIAGGIEEGVTSRGNNQIYLIGGDRLYQA